MNDLRVKTDDLDALYDAACLGLAFLADPDGLAASRTDYQEYIRRALQPFRADVLAREQAQGLNDGRLRLDRHDDRGLYGHTMGPRLMCGKCLTGGFPLTPRSGSGGGRG